MHYYYKRRHLYNLAMEAVNYKTNFNCNFVACIGQYVMFDII